MQIRGLPFKFSDLFAAVISQNAQDQTARPAVCWIVSGCVLGLLLALTNYVLQPQLDPQILAVVIVTVWIAATGARHLQGLGESFLLRAYPAEPVNQTAGFIAVALVILFKCAAVESMHEIATLSLFLTPLLARWGLLVFLYGYGSRCDPPTSRLAEQIRFLPVLGGSALTLALTMYFLGRKGLWIALSVSIFMLLLRELCFRWRATLARAHLGAAIESSEALALVLLASL